MVGKDPRSLALAKLGQLTEAREYSTHHPYRHLLPQPSLLITRPQTYWEILMLKGPYAWPGLGELTGKGSLGCEPSVEVKVGPQQPSSECIHCPSSSFPRDSIEFKTSYLPSLHIFLSS
jgi:hypothetical protein